MKEIKTDEDVAALRAEGVRSELAELAARKLQYIKDAFALLDATYDPDADGFIVLLEGDDDFAAVTGLASGAEVRGLAEHTERHEEGAWEIVTCPSNSWAWTFLVPDEVLLPTGVAAELARQASRHDLIPCGAGPSPF